MPQGGHQGRQDPPAPQGRLEGGTGKAPQNLWAWVGGVRLGRAGELEKPWPPMGHRVGMRQPQVLLLSYPALPQVQKMHVEQIGGGQRWDPPSMCSDLK